MKLIAICGYKRSGKDTIANYIQRSVCFSNHCKISSNLKEGCMSMFGFTNEQLEGDLKEVKDPFWNITPREAMQYIGTDVMQYEIQKLIPDIGRRFWIKRFIHHIQSNHSNIVIVSDLRFMHEYIELKKHFDTHLYIIKVIRDTINHDDHHISEREWKDIPSDVCICNNGSLEKLYNNIDTYLKKNNLVE
jgi:hypothetical protein